MTIRKGLPITPVDRVSAREQQAPKTRGDMPKDGKTFAMILAEAMSANPKGGKHAD